MKHLSKSDYLKYRIHPAYLWYQKNQPRRLPKPDANQEYIFEQGRQFESLVQTLFKEAATITGKPWEFEALTAQTEAVIDSASTLFQASFMTQDRLFCASDILERVDNGWILSEVKSSTSVKQTHIYDVAFQKLVMERLGYKVAACRVIHVNRAYSRSSSLDPQQMSLVRDITEEVNDVMETVEREVNEAQRTMELAEVDDHPALAGSLSDWLPIYKHLHPQLAADSVLNFASAKPQQIRQWYQQGFERIEELNPKELNERQAKVVEAARNHGPIVDQEALQAFLSKLQYPLYFLDYETSAHVIPLYERTKPYQQVPFQYSLHKLERAGGPLEHFEYLHESADLPAQMLSESLLTHTGNHGTVIAWFDKFEKYCNRTLAQLVPDYAETLLAINRRMVDLRIPFVNDAYVDADFRGSSSIKNVLPVLVPHLSYKQLGIQEGGAAQRQWQQAIFDKADHREATLKDLKEYCQLDTLAMVEIYHKLVASSAYEPQPAQSSLFT